MTRLNHRTDEENRDQFAETEERAQKLLLKRPGNDLVRATLHTQLACFGHALDHPADEVRDHLRRAGVLWAEHWNGRTAHDGETIPYLFVQALSLCPSVGRADAVSTTPLSAWNHRPTPVQRALTHTILAWQRTLRGEPVDVHGSLDRVASVRRWRGSAFTIVREKPGWIHTDGEPRAEVTRIEISVRPRSLKILVPAPNATAS